MKRRAVFLDRDGVLVRAVPHEDYAHGPLTLEEFALLPDIVEPVRMVRKAGFLTVLATNQPGIARGRMDWQTLHQMHHLLQAAIPLDDIEVCPHTDADQCLCRKPKPGMLLAAGEKLSIDLSQSFFIGDTHRDVDAARAAGVTPILLDRPYNRKADVQFRVASLAEAAGLICAQC